MLTDKGFELLGQHKNLELLSVVGGDFTDDGLAHLSHLDKLRHLKISGLQLTDAGLVHLSGLENAYGLSLGGQITGKGFENVRGMNSLSNLSLRGCPVTADGLAAVANPKQCSSSHSGFHKSHRRRITASVSDEQS